MTETCSAKSNRTAVVPMDTFGPSNGPLNTTPTAPSERSPGGHQLVADPLQARSGSPTQGTAILSRVRTLAGGIPFSPLFLGSLFLGIVLLSGLWSLVLWPSGLETMLTMAGIQPSITTAAVLVGVLASLMIIVLTGLMALCRIREQRAEKRLRQSEARYSAAQRLSRMGHYEFDFETGRAVWSDGLFEIWGIRQDGDPRGIEFWLSTIHPDDRERTYKTFLERASSQEYRIIRADGAVRHIITESVFEVGGGNRLLSQFAVAQDITERREREFDLISAIQQTRLLVAALEANPSGIVIADPNVPTLPIIHVNRAFTEITGFEMEQAIGRSPRFLLGRESNRAAVREVWQAVRERRKTWVEMICYRRNRDPFWNELTVAPVFNDDGSLVAFVGAIKDATNERKHQERLRQFQKLEALGHMAGGIAHELNNLLQPVMTFSSLTMKALPPGSKLWENQLSILESSRRARDIIRNILTFAHGGEPRNEAVDLVTIARSVVRFARDALPSTVMITDRIGAKSLVAVASQTEFFQVLLNFFNNAAYAMDFRGRLEVSADVEAIDETTAPALGLLPGPHAVFAVRDEGCGMDPGTVSRIFEPFYTTKPVGQGTGLGLSIAYGIIRRWKGTITVDSEPGIGTTFRVFIPVEPDRGGI